MIRVITDDLPRYFALVSRCREDICQVGPNGGDLESSVNIHAKATFPKDALMKEIKVGIQVPKLKNEFLKVLGESALQIYHIFHIMFNIFRSGQYHWN